MLPPTTFDTVSCLCSPAIAIHQNSTFATSQTAVSGTKLNNAAARSAALAIEKKRLRKGILIEEEEHVDLEKT